MSNFTKFLLVVGLIVVAFSAGSCVESERGHRNACAQQGGSYNWYSRTCSFDGPYDNAARIAMAASCPIPGKSWYLINNSNTGWFHKCD